MSVKRKIDLYLSEVISKYIIIKDDNLKRSQEVFKSVFEQMKQKMGGQCNFFNKYSSQVMYGGSVFDGIKVSRMDEFDMDIVIKLPISYEDGPNGIIFENDQPGYIKLKIMNAFDNLDNQPNWENCHKVTRDWRDSDKYFLQNKFRQWMHSIVEKALKDMKYQVEVNGEKFSLTYKESGPAFTLHVRNCPDNDPFKLDVDLVPVIRFQLPRWPEGYRKIESSDTTKDWLVVPKPNKALTDISKKSQCWRLSFQVFEKDLMKNCQSLKLSIRLIKKLRDSLDLKEIASYYIKTLFLWKVEKEDKTYWRNKLSVIFHDMLEVLYTAVNSKDIPYFWNKNHNLIKGMKPTLQSVYAKKILSILNSVKANDIDAVVVSLLTKEEFTEFQNSEFYKRQLASSTPIRQLSLVPASIQEIRDSIDGSKQEDCASCGGKLKEIEERLNDLTDQVSSVMERLNRLELTMKLESLSMTPSTGNNVDVLIDF